MDNGLFAPDKIKMREKFKEYPLFFCETLAPKKFYIPWSSYHPIMADEIVSPSGNVKITMFLANRGGGKSTFFLGGMSLYKIICQGYQNVIFGSYVEDTAKEFLSHPKSILQGDICNYYYGDLLQKAPGVDRKEISKKRMILYSKELGVHARISVKGTDSMWAGINFDIAEESVRWQLLMLDDVEVEKTALSSDQVDQLITWLTKTVMFGKDTNTRINSHIYLIGTTYYPNAALERLQKFVKVVKTFVFPVMVTGKRKSWLIENLKSPDDKPLKEGDSTWEQNPAFTKKEMLRERDLYISMNKLGEWNSQRLLEPSAIGGDRFDISKFRKFDIEGNYIIEKDCDMSTKIRFDDLLFYILIDAAYTIKKHSDPLAIMLWGMDWRNNFFLWDEFIGKVDVGSFLDGLEGMLRRNALNKENFQMVGLESICFEYYSLFIEAILKKVGLDILIEELKPGIIPKQSRIRKLIPCGSQGRIWIKEGLMGFENEAANFDAGAKTMKGFNGLDVSAYLVNADLVIPPKPPEDKVAKKKKGQAAAFDLLFGERIRQLDPKNMDSFRGIRHKRMTDDHIL